MQGGRLSPTRPAAASSPAAPAARAQALVDALGARVFVDVVIPRTEIRAKMRLVTRAERFAAVAAARQQLEGARFPVDGKALASLGGDEQWEYELAIQLLAIAVREPTNTQLALACVEDWRESCDDDQIATLVRQYDDLAARLDPLGEGAGLTEAEHAALVDAAKKKDVVRLMDFGSRKLALFVTTSVSPPATSATPT